MFLLIITKSLCYVTNSFINNDIILIIVTMMKLHFYKQMHGLVWFVFCGTGDKPRAFSLTNIPSLFYIFILRQDLTKLLHRSGWAQSFDPPASASQRAGFTDMHHHTRVTNACLNTLHYSSEYYKIKTTKDPALDLRV